MRKISQKGADFIASFEKEVLHVYDDGYGYPTAGIGHRVNLPIGTKVTQAQSREWFRQDLAKYGDAVDKAVNVPITQNEFDALTSLCFNIGIGAFRGSSLLRQLNARNYQACADGFRRWNKSNGKVSKGLVRRREAERKIFLTPDSAEPKPVQLAPEPLEQPDTTGKESADSQPDNSQADSPASPPSYWSKFKSIFVKVDATGDQVQSVTGTFEKFSGLPTLPTGLGTRLIVIAKFIFAGILMALQFIYSNRDYFYGAIILALVAGFIWNQSRNRNNPPGAVPMNGK